MARRTPVFTALVVVIASFFALPVAWARSCFPETNHCIDGRIEQYWNANGGLAVFGFPIAPQAPEVNRDTGQTYQTQWMERNRFELHPENAGPYDVLLGRLGDDRLRQQGVDWQTLPKADPQAPHYFAQTGHAVTHEPFWQYWRSHGLDLGDGGISERESLALFGYPITEARVETNSSGDTVLTQWFERARFEYHPSNPEPYKVLLGLLGNEVRGTTLPTEPPASPAPSASPLPSASPSPLPSTSPAPAPLPPSFNNCAEDPNKDRAPDFPVRIESVDKVAEAVILKNVNNQVVDITGWRICSIRGNQLHTTLSGTIQGGEQIVVPSTADGNIWSNSEDDDAALYDANGSLVSYWDD